MSLADDSLVNLFIDAFGRKEEKVHISEDKKLLYCCGHV